MLQRSEFTRLVSMIFLLVILLMIIQNSRGPDKHALLIGRAGNQDRVVGRIDDDSIGEPERVPEARKPSAAATGSRSLSRKSLALAQGSSGPTENSLAPKAAEASKAPQTAPTASGNAAAVAPVPAANSAATKDTSAQAKAVQAKAAQAKAAQGKAAQGKGNEATSAPAVSIPYNMAPAPIAPVPTAPVSNAPPAAPNAAAKAIPPASGPTDEDREESDPAVDEFQAVADGTTKTGLVEMPAYERTLRWVTNQSYERLAARAQFKRLNRAQLIAAADDRRGKLFQFKLHVRSMIPFEDKVHFYQNEDDPHEPVQIYDLWGDTDESKGRLYQLVVYDPPAGMPIGDLINEDVEFAGYFFKLQAYEPGRAQRGAPPEIGPTFIGRILWIQRPPTVLVNQSDIWWIIAIGGSVVAILFAWFAWLFFRKARPNVAQLSIDMSFPSTVSIDDWLEHPSSGADSGGRDTSRAVDSGTDETEALPARNGHGNGHTGRFSERPDGDRT